MARDVAEVTFCAAIVVGAIYGDARAVALAILLVAMALLDIRDTLRKGAR